MSNRNRRRVQTAELRATGMTLAQISRTVDQPQKSKAVWVAVSVVLFGMASAAGTYLALGPQTGAPARMAALEPEQAPQVPEVLTDAIPVTDITPAPLAPVEEEALAPATAAVDVPAADPIAPAETLVTTVAAVVEPEPLEVTVAAAPVPVAAAPEDCVARLDAIAAALIVPFEPYATRPTPSDITPVIDLAQRVAECDVAHLVVAGHADPSGDETENLLLSWQRAEFVVAALTEAGFDQNRLEAIGFGSRRPLSEGAAGADDTLNRRVDFVVRAALP